MAIPRNPFTPTFGSVPPFLAGRRGIVSSILAGLDNGPGDPNLSTIFSGEHGSGKTTLLTYISQNALIHGWIAIDVSATPGMLEDIVERTLETAQELVESLSLESGKNISWSRSDVRKGNWRTQMNSILGKLRRIGYGLVITVDEVDSNFDELLQLVTIYQHFVREKRRVALFMADTPEKASSLMEGNVASFLRKVQVRRLGRISGPEIELTLRRTIESAGRMIEPVALKIATDSIDGSPYVMQLVGFRSWNVSPESIVISASDVKHGIALARHDYDDRYL